MVAVLSALVAWRFRWSEMWVVTIGLVTALALGWLATTVAARVHGRRGAVPPRVEVGESLPMEVVLVNPSRRRQPAQRAHDSLGEMAVEVDLPVVPARGETTHQYEVSPDRRGRIDLGPLTVDRSDPLGLFVATRVLVRPVSVIVHPRHHPLSSVAVGGRRDLDGRDAVLAEGSITFHTLRDYVLGDDLRRVHWRSSARTGSLVVRQDIDPSEPRTTIVLDRFEDAWADGSFEDGVEVAASVVHALVAGDHPISYVDDSMVIPDVDHGRTTLDALSEVATTTADAFIARAATAATDGGGLVVLITGDDIRGDEALTAASIGGPVALVVVRPGRPPAFERRPGSVVVTASSAAEVCLTWRGAS